MIEPESTPRPLLQLARTDRLIRVYVAGDRYTMTVTRLRQKPMTHNDLTEADAFRLLVLELNEEASL